MANENTVRVPNGSNDDRAVEEWLEVLAKTHPDLVPDRLIRSKEVVADSDLLSSKILQGLKQRLSS